MPQGHCQEWHHKLKVVWHIYASITYKSVNVLENLNDAEEVGNWGNEIESKQPTVRATESPTNRQKRLELERMSPWLTRMAKYCINTGRYKSYLHLSLALHMRLKLVPGIKRGTNLKSKSCCYMSDFLYLSWQLMRLSLLWEYKNMFACSVSSQLLHACILGYDWFMNTNRFLLL